MRHFAVGITLALLVGCSPSPTPTPTPVPTYQCTPEAGGTPAPCSAAAYEEMKKKDALYAEAESLFRRLTKETERVGRLGGSSSITPEFIELLGSEDLLREVAVNIEADLKDQVVVKGDAFRIAWLHRAPGISKGGSEVAIKGCVDMSGARYYEKGKFVSNGSTLVRTLYAGKVDGSVKIVGLAFEVVKSCD